jgi:hypothetical protein
VNAHDWAIDSECNINKRGFLRPERIGWEAFAMLLANPFKVSIAQGLSKVLGWLAVLFIASTTTFIAVLASGVFSDLSWPCWLRLGFACVAHVLIATKLIPEMPRQAFTSLPMFQEGYIDSDGQWVDKAGSHAIESAVLPSVLVFLLSAAVAFSFTNVWNIATSTVLFSFLLDAQRAKAGLYQEPDPDFSVTKQR